MERLDEVLTMETPGSASQEHGSLPQPQHPLALDLGEKIRGKNKNRVNSPYSQSFHGLPCNSREPFCHQSIAELWMLLRARGKGGLTDPEPRDNTRRGKSSQPRNAGGHHNHRESVGFVCAFFCTKMLQQFQLN